MKIAFINQPWNRVVPPVQSGSIAIWTYEVARRLAQSFDVIVYARGGLFQNKVERDEGVQYRHVLIIPDRLLLKLFGVFSGFYQTKRPLFASRLYYLVYILQVANDLRKQQCDIVHIHNFSQFVPVLRAFNPNITIVLHMHCEWLTQLDQTMVEQRIKKADLVIGCSNYMTKKIQNAFPQFVSRCQTVYNGVRIDHFCKVNSHPEVKGNSIKRLLFVGRVSPEKGVHVLLEAFQKVVNHYPQAQLEIVGAIGSTPIEFVLALSDDPKVLGLAPFYRGSYLSHLQDKLTPDVANKISFTGFVPHLQLIKYYQDADILINPSVWNEPFGVPLVEAMATELPVVATRSGGMREIVEEGTTGLLVERGDASALAEAILCLLSDEDLRNSMGKTAGKRVVERFSWEQITDSLLCKYRDVCENHM